MKRNDLDIDNSTVIEECKNGNREAMSLLYTRFAPRMMHVISRYISDKDDARDVLHDGFVAAYTRLDSLRDPDRLEFWLATIMKNISLKMLQSQNVESILEEIPESEENAELEATLDFETIQLLIGQLPDGYQKVFRLAVLENKSHKVISKILGIAPKSSSSQLFHAKLMMRKLIKDYRKEASILTILIIVATAGSLMLFKYTSGEEVTDGLMTVDASAEKDIKNDGDSEFPAKHNKQLSGHGSHASGTSAHLPSSMFASSPGTTIAPHIISTEDSDSDISDAEKVEESISIEEPQIIAIAEENKVEEKLNPSKVDSAKYTLDTTFNQDIFYIESTKKRRIRKGWSAGIAFNTGSSIPVNDYTALGNGFCGDPGQTYPPQPDDTETKPDNNDTGQQMQTRDGKEDSLDKLNSQSSTSYIPITIGVTAEKRFNSWLGLESGLSYTFLRTDFESRLEKTICQWHYLDIPLKVNLYVYDSSRFALYGSAGGRFAIPIHSFASIRSKVFDRDAKTTFRSNTVWSLGGSIGFSYHLSKRLDLYLEPSIQYHFPSDFKVKNVWNEECWHFSIPIGVRFNW